MLVSFHVDQIIELANYFEEDDVLERNGSRVTRRPDASDKAFAEWAERNYPRAS